MSDSRTKKELFLPYRYQRLGVHLEVTSVSLDGNTRAAADSERKLVSVDSYPWTTAEIGLSAELADGLIAQVLPPEEHASPPVRVLVAATCPDTRLRFGIHLMPCDATQTRFVGTLRVGRDAVAGHVELEPFLIRPDPLGKAPDGYARHVGARLAGGRPWEVRVDRRRLPEGEYLDVRFKSFTADPNIEPRDRVQVWKLECDLPTPTLWLNLDHTAVHQAMSSQASVGANARIREVAYDQLAFPVWSRLLLRAVEHRFGTGESVYDWEEGVLETLATWMYPDEHTLTAQLRKLEYEHDDLVALLGRLDATLQREHGFAEHLTRLIDEAQR